MIYETLPASPPTLDVVLRASALDQGGYRGAEDRTRELVQDLLRRRGAFGITRVGSVTRLDRIGLPVVQVVRPLSRSNAVSQGKGLSLMEAAASALMEELEVWAAEAILPAATRTATMDELGPEVATLYSSVLAPEASSDWRKTPLCWLQAVDLLTGREWPVPAALVDTVYTVPSPHPRIFPRTTTGLGAGLTMGNAILQAALEILERHGVNRAHATPRFFDLHQIDPDSVRGALGSRVLNLVRAAGLLVGIWQVRASHELPIYWCHVMESAGSSELAPLPAAGYGCDLTHDGALAKALMEACQARLTAISGAREDITRAAYPTSFDRDHLAAWRDQLQSPARARALPRERAVDSAPLDAAIVALEREGARAVLVVPLHQDQMVGICVVRLVAPPLRSAPGL